MRLAQFAGLIEGERAETHVAQIAAIKELLDRGYGKAAIPLASDTERPLAFEIVWGPARAPEADAADGAIVDAALTNDDDEGADSITPRIVWDSGTR
jgi:hypothetical protein